MNATRLLRSLWLLLLLLATGQLVPGATGTDEAGKLRALSAAPAPELEALFARTNGWIGADGDYSVAVTPERTLWFFSDTWIGRVIGGHRTNATMINNSVGVQTGAGRDARVDYFWDTSTGAKPAALFRPADGHGWFWPFAGTMVSNTLQLFLWQMEKTTEPGAFGFRNVAVWHGEISNPLSAPREWSVRQRKLPFTENTEARRLFFGSAILRHDGHLYIYGVDERRAGKGFSRGMAVARVEERSLGDFARWRFWHAGEWREDFREATSVASGMATEYSVTHLPALGRFVAVTHDVFLSPNIIARTAPQPWGPWSEPVRLYACPEAGWKKGFFCYAGKAQPSFSSTNELVISYAANAGDFVDVLRDARLYWPRFVRVKLGWSP